MVEQVKKQFEEACLMSFTVSRRGEATQKLPLPGPTSVTITEDLAKFQDMFDQSMDQAIINQLGILMGSIKDAVRNILAEGLQMGNVGPCYPNAETSAAATARMPPPTSNGVPPPQPSAPMTGAGADLTSPYVLRRQPSTTQVQRPSAIGFIPNPVSSPIEGAYNVSPGFVPTSLGMPPVSWLYIFPRMFAQPVHTTASPVGTLPLALPASTTPQRQQSPSAHPQTGGHQEDASAAQAMANHVVPLASPQTQRTFQDLAFQMSERMTQQSDVDWASKIANVMKNQFSLKPKEPAFVYRRPYPEAYNQIPLHDQYRVSDFTKFSGHDNVSTIEHINKFLVQCGAVSATDALKIRLFPLSLSGSAFS